MTPEYIVLHHSLTADGRTVSWDAIRRYHTQRLGWRDIGYHFGIERVGERYEILCGRMMNARGAHCLQYAMNTRSIGVCFVGNFDNVPPPVEQWDLGLRLVKTLAEIFAVPQDRVRGHREFAGYKSCPGLRFDTDLFRHQLA
jgi:N-acetylmuramoyl-L-alanine amidase